MDNKDLIKAVLSLAAYDSSDSKLADIGGAHRISEATQELSDGFAAVVYEIGNKYIISFRGTNDNADIFSGWPVGLGVPTASQALAALNFYKSTIDAIGEARCEGAMLFGRDCSHLILENYS